MVEQERKEKENINEITKEQTLQSSIVQTGRRHLITICCVLGRIAEDRCVWRVVGETEDCKLIAAVASSRLFKSYIENRLL